MANAMSHNRPKDAARMNRPAYEQTKTHRHFQEVSASDLGTTAVHLNAYIAAQTLGMTAPGTLKCRTHVEITNTHATAIIYVKRWVTGGLEATTAIYQHKLAAAGGYVKIPMDADMDLSIISDVASSTTALITELG